MKVTGTQHAETPTLDEVCEFIVDCLHKTAPTQSTGYPSIRTPNVGWGRLTLEGVNRVSEDVYAEWTKRAIPEPDDLIMAREAPAGNVAIIGEGQTVCLGQRTVHLRPDCEKVDPAFLCYYLLAPRQQGALLAGETGATARHVNMRDIRRLKLGSLPTVPTQRKLGQILSAYDDLIENNRRRIALLEEAARLLYREWFVHFRFPGHEQVKITNGLPEGWERVKMEQVLIALESGGRPRGGASENEGIPSIGAENVIALGQYDFSKEKYVPEEYFAKMRRGVIKSRDVLLYKDGANIGRSSMFGDGFPHFQCAVNEHVFILRASAKVGQNYLYFWLSQPETRQSIVNLNSNTAQPGISQDKLKTLRFSLPPEPLRNLFNEHVEAQVAQVFRLALLNQKLAQARDLLLPRLMNGAIAV